MQKITVNNVNVFAIYSKSNIQNFYILVHFVCRLLKIDISFYIAVRAKFKFFRGLLDFPKKRHSCSWCNAQIDPINWRPLKSWSKKVRKTESDNSWALWPLKQFFNYQAFKYLSGRNYDALWSDYDGISFLFTENKWVPFLHWKSKAAIFKSSTVTTDITSLCIFGPWLKTDFSRFSETSVLRIWQYIKTTLR